LTNTVGFMPEHATKNTIASKQIDRKVFNNILPSLSNRSKRGPESNLQSGRIAAA